MAKVTIEIEVDSKQEEMAKAHLEKMGYAIAGEAPEKEEAKEDLAEELGGGEMKRQLNAMQGTEKPEKEEDND